MISKEERDILRFLRLCKPHDANNDPFSLIGLSSDRILVPARVAHLFSGLKSRRGRVLRDLPLQDIVLRAAKPNLGRKYRRSSIPVDAGSQMNCSTFTKELYAKIGVYLPRYSIDQSYEGIETEDPLPGDLLFFENSYPIQDPNRSIGHVALLVDDQHMMHGTPQLGNFQKVPTRAHRFARRILPEGEWVLVILPPRPLGLETALDVARWLQRPEGPTT